MDEAGIDFVELFPEEATTENLAALRAAGMHVGTVPVWFEFTADTFDPANSDFLRTPIDVGASRLMILPSLLRPEDGPDAFARNVDGIRAVARLCRDAGIVPVIENFGFLRSPTCNPDDIACILDAIPELSMNFDTGNFAVLGISPLDIYPRFAGRIVSLHAKDRTTSADAVGEEVVAPDGTAYRCCPVGAGEIPFDALFSRLAADGIDVPVAIECFGVPDMLSAVLESACFLRGLVPSTLSGCLSPLTVSVPTDGCLSPLTGVCPHGRVSVPNRGKSDYTPGLE